MTEELLYNEQQEEFDFRIPFTGKGYVTKEIDVVRFLRNVETLAEDEKSWLIEFIRVINIASFQSTKIVFRSHNTEWELYHYFSRQKGHLDRAKEFLVYMDPMFNDLLSLQRSFGVEIDDWENYLEEAFLKSEKILGRICLLVGEEIQKQFGPTTKWCNKEKLIST